VCAARRSSSRSVIKHAHARGHERLGDGEADPARGAGHDCSAALQLWQPGHHALLPGRRATVATAEGEVQVRATRGPFDGTCDHPRMRIGLGAGAATIERIVEQATEAEAAGFSTLWYPSAVLGDPLAPIAVAGRATSSIELGTAVLQTYTAHPLLTAARGTSVAAAMGRPGFALGLGPSHDRPVEGMYGLSYSHVGRHTEEYTRIVVAALRGDDVDVDGEDFRVHARSPQAAPFPVPVLLGALAPRMLRVAGEVADGTITWMANREALEAHVVPRIRAAAVAADRPEPRIVVGLPVAVHDDVDEARDDAARQYGFYGDLPNYARILRTGGLERAADACVVGDEESVAAQLRSLVDAGATDVWAAIFPVGADRRASRARTRALLEHLVHEE
jgi:F420-dependent oxidoreductase-like protein